MALIEFDPFVVIGISFQYIYLKIFMKKFLNFPSTQIHMICFLFFIFSWKMSLSLLIHTKKKLWIWLHPWSTYVKPSVLHRINKLTVDFLTVTPYNCILESMHFTYTYTFFPTTASYLFVKQINLSYILSPWKWFFCIVIYSLTK